MREIILINGKLIMRSFRLILGFVLIFLLSSCSGNKGKKIISDQDKTGNFYVGWSSEDITPDSPVLVSGQFPARVSEGVLDPITVTALAIESGTGSSSEKVIMISCDLVSIRDGTRSGSANNLRDNVRNLLKESIPELNPEQIIINATHTHTGPYCSETISSKSAYGIELDVLSPSDCQKYISESIAKAATDAWKSRKPGGISFGLGHAVVGHNRLQVNLSEKSRMYGNTNNPEFSHFEGYEDHSVNLLYTWDKKSELTGVVINIACPSQVTESLYKISADYWHDTRLEVRQRFGKDVYILPQCSAAGDQSPHVLVGNKGEERMQKIMFPDSMKTGDRTIAHRKQIAIRIADAVMSVFPYMKDNIDWNPEFAHHVDTVNLSRRLISLKDVNSALKEGKGWEKKYEELLNEIKENPEIKDKPRWYSSVTSAYKRMKRGYSVKERYELEKKQKKMPIEVHVTRIGDVVIATNPFELYLDYGMRIKARSNAVQTFLVQLTGSGSYLPPIRSVAGGSYGAVLASTLMGPVGGQELVEKTLEMINNIME